MLNAIYYPKVRLFDSLYVPHILKDIYIQGSYNDFFLPGRTDMVVVDFGANCGLTTQYFREFSRKVYSMEPCPDQFEALSKNKEVNGWDNVEIFNLAIAATDGEARFHTNRSNMTAGSLDNPFYSILSTSRMEYDNPVTVKTVTIDTFFREQGITSVDFLKLDIEGQEHEIIRTSGFANVMPMVKGMLVEFHTNDWEFLYDYMGQFKFYSKRLPVDTVSYLFSREDLWH